MITPFKNFLKKLFKNQLIAGSAVLFIGNGLASFGTYLYHLFMGRMLGPVNYGILASLISIAYLISIPMTTLSLVVVKYVSDLRGKKDFGVIGYFYSWLNKKLLCFGVPAFLILTIISPRIARFLHIDSALLVWLMILASLVTIITTVNISVIQGFLRFGLRSILAIIQVFLKLLVAVFLVYFGWQVLGAVLGMMVEALAGSLLGAFFVSRLLRNLKKEKKGINVAEIINFAVPVLLSTLAFTSLYTADIVLARHFLPAQEAGFYSALATLGKIIFFASSPIVLVMFPMVSERHANGKKYLNLLSLSFGLVVFVCFGISLIYFLFPKLMIKILFGSQYLAPAPYLWLFAVFLSLYSLSSLLVNFYLSVKKVNVVVLPVIAAAAQATLITVFHESLSQVVWVSVSILGLLTVSLLLYFFLSYAQDKKALAFRHCPRLQTRKDNC